MKRAVQKFALKTSAINLGGLKPLAPIQAENFSQQLFISGASGPSGVMDVAGLRQIRASSDRAIGHGVHAPAAMDGHPANTIGPGARYDCDFTVRNRGRTYWYHTHAHELTAKPAYNGLASFYRLAFVKNNVRLEFAVIGTSGGLLDQAQNVAEAFLAPGIRSDGKRRSPPATRGERWVIWG